jgi:SPP1 family predicted phage head-tail adaptor
MVHIKDKKITILQITEDYDDIGNPIEVEEPIPGGENIWAYYRQTSGSEYFAARTVNSKEEVVFEINWRNDIDTTMKILYKGKKYNITRIDDYEGYKQDLKIYAYAMNPEEESG